MNYENISYTLKYKNVKNINLRVLKNGEIHVSAPFYTKKERIEYFVNSKKDWIKSCLRKISQQTVQNIPDDEECLKIFLPIADKIYPLFEKNLDMKPRILVKNLTASWGICHYTKNYIVLNKALALKPAPAIEYVILHEYVHFLEHNHQKGFYKILSQIMPDYKQRRKLLRN